MGDTALLVVTTDAMTAAAVTGWIADQMPDEPVREVGGFYAAVAELRRGRVVVVADAGLDAVNAPGNRTVDRLQESGLAVMSRGDRRGQLLVHCHRQRAERAAVTQHVALALQLVDLRLYVGHMLLHGERLADRRG